MRRLIACLLVIMMMIDLVPVSAEGIWVDEPEVQTVELVTEAEEEVPVVEETEEVIPEETVVEEEDPVPQETAKPAPAEEPVQQPVEEAQVIVVPEEPEQAEVPEQTEEAMEETEQVTETDPVQLPEDTEEEVSDEAAAEEPEQEMQPTVEDVEEEQTEVSDEQEEPEIEQTEVAFAVRYIKLLAGTKLYRTEHLNGETEELAEDAIVLAEEMNEQKTAVFITFQQDDVIVHAWVKADAVRELTENELDEYEPEGLTYQQYAFNPVVLVVKETIVESVTEDLAEEDEVEVSLAVASIRIDDQPVTQVGNLGAYVNFTVQVSGGTAPYTYQWQYRTSENDSWKNSSQTTAKTNSLTKVQITEARLSYGYKCVITDAAGKFIETNVVGLKIKTDSDIKLVQPVDYVGKLDTYASFTVQVSGGTAPYTYQWKYRTSENDSWKNSSQTTAKTNSLTKVQITEARLSYEYKCVITDADGCTAETNVVYLKQLLLDPQIITQPESTEAEAGTNAILTLVVEDVENYQWQYKAPGTTTWTAVPSTWTGAKTDTLKIPFSAKYKGYKFRCSMIGGDIKVISDEVSVKLVPTIVKQPEEMFVVPGEKGTLTVEAINATGYRWQYSKDGGATWANSTAAGSSTSSIEVELNEERYNNLYRCVVKGEVNVYSEAVQFKPDMAIITQPYTNGEVGIGENGVLKMEAAGATAYRWQYSKDNGTTWSNALTSWTGYNQPQMTIEMTEQRFGYLFRCKVTGLTGSAYTDTVSFVQRVQIIEQPKAAEVAVDDMGVLHIAAAAAVSYRWQYSKDNGATWTNALTSWTGYNTDTLNVPMTEARLTYLFRCKVTGKSEVIYSDAVRFVALPKITVQPVDVEAGLNEKAVLKLTATSATGYQWQYSTDNGATWHLLSSTSAKTDTLTLTMGTKQFGYVYRCKVLGAKTIYSDTVKVKQIPVITAQPVAGYVAQGDSGVLTVKATGAAGYRWQYSKDGGATWAFSTAEGYNTNSIKIVLNEERYNNLYRCRITGGKTIYTNAVQFKEGVKITKQPYTNGEVVSGDVGVLTVEATGAKSYRWYYSKDEGATWTAALTTWTGYNKAQMSIEITQARLGYVFRCDVTGADKKVSSEYVRFTQGLTITDQPKAGEAAQDDVMTLSVGALAAKSYRWYYSTDDGATWKAAPTTWTGYNQATVTVNLTATRIKYSFRCAVTGSKGTIYTDTVKFTEIPKITKQPTAGFVANGDTGYLTVTATGATGYRWQYSKDGGATWTNSTAEGYDTPKLAIVLSDARYGYLYRCRILGNKTIYSDAVQFKEAVKITKQPVGVVAKVGQVVTLSVTATGAKSYLWQYSSNGGSTWNTASSSIMSGYTTDTLKITYNASYINDNMIFRCAVTGADKTVYTSQVKVQRDVEITVQPTAGKAWIGDTVYLSVTAVGASTYQWQRKKPSATTWTSLTDDNSSGSKTNRLMLVLTDTSFSYEYRCVVTGVKNKAYTNAVQFTSGVTGVTLNTAETTLYLTQTTTLKATVAPANATNKNVTWKSSSTSVATVDEKGVVTAKAPGTAIITVSTVDRMKNGYAATATCTVTVKAPTMVLTVPSNKMSVGDKMTIKPTLDPVLPATYTFSSSNTNYATVDANGVVTAKAIGSVNITVKAAITGTTQVVTMTYAISIEKSPVLLTIKGNASMNVGETQKLTTTTVPFVDGTNKSWTSSNTTVATVDSTGTVTAKAKGTATITHSMTYNGASYSATFQITVADAVPTAITLSSSSLTMTVGNTQSVTATITPSTATTTITWKSSNTAVATVSATTGKSVTVTAKGEGTATITATTSNGMTASCTVKVSATTVAPTAIKLNVTSQSLTVGKTLSLSATLTPSSAATTISWTTSNSAVASVSASTGSSVTVTAKATGSATITAKTSNGLAASCTVTVVSATVEPTSISVSPTSVAMKVGDTSTLSFTLSPSNATTNVTWKSSNTGVVSLTNASGSQVTMNAVAAGTATVTATTGNGKSASCTVTVTANTKYRALLIGQVHYSPVCWRNAGDIDRLSEVLTSVKEPWKISSYTDCTKANVKSLISSTFSGATADDISLFFYAGHGEASAPASDPIAGAMETYNGEVILASELASWLSAIPGKVIVLLGTCGSGAMIYANGVYNADESADISRRLSAHNSAFISAFAAADPGLYVTNAIEGFEEITVSVSVDTTAEYYATATDLEPVVRLVEHSEMDVVDYVPAMNVGELRKSKFYVLTAAAFQRNSLGSEGSSRADSLNLFMEAMYRAVVYGSTGSTRFAADANSDGKITLAECYNYMYPICNKYSYVDQRTGITYYQEIRVYPTNSNFVLFTKK